MNLRQFDTGDIVRSRNPYWGEPAYLIRCSDNHGYYADAIGGKYNVGRIHIPHNSLNAPEGAYTRCPKLMVAWLRLLGAITRALADMRKY